jgi:hypothetical protein
VRACDLGAGQGFFDPHHLFTLGAFETQHDRTWSEIELPMFAAERDTLLIILMLIREDSYSQDGKNRWNSDLCVFAPLRETLSRQVAKTQSTNRESLDIFFAGHLK